MNFLRTLVKVDRRNVSLPQYGYFKMTEVKLGTSTGKYQVEAYKVVKGVEGLDAHHPGQKAAMKRLVDNYDLNTALARYS